MKIPQHTIIKLLQRELRAELLFDLVLATFSITLVDGALSVVAPEPFCSFSGNRRGSGEVGRTGGLESGGVGGTNALEPDKISSSMPSGFCSTLISSCLK